MGRCEECLNPHPLLCNSGPPNIPSFPGLPFLQILITSSMYTGKARNEATPNMVYAKNYADNSPGIETAVK